VVSYEVVFTKQVQMLGLHVLRSYAQEELTEGSETKTDSFMMLLTELLGDVFLVMQTTLKVLCGILLAIGCRNFCKIGWCYLT
jgi:hypothetical protein